LRASALSSSTVGALVGPLWADTKSKCLKRRNQ
jgi:hypothetical protein